MKSIQTTVAVIGGGSVGLAMALELGWQGVPVVLLEQTDGSITTARAGGLSIRSAEYCRRWGIFDEVHERGFPGTYRLDTVFCTSLNGYELGRRAGETMDEPDRRRESPAHRQRIPQMVLDPILARTARSFEHVELRHKHVVEGFTDKGDEVVVQAYDQVAQEPIELTARCLVAADGAKSPTRESLNIAVSGDPLIDYSLNILLRSPGLSDKISIEQAERYILVSEQGTWGNLTVVDGSTLWRLTVIVGKEKPDLTTFDVNSAVSRAFGDKVIPYEVVSVQPWRRSALVADRFHTGNSLIAGDAAHTMSPTGGFGMNTGLSDVVNLGWKIRAVVEGWGGDLLFQSYTDERRPVAVRNVHASSTNFKGWLPGVNLGPITDPGPAGDDLRSEVGRKLLDGTRQEWESIGVSLGYRYDPSPICVSDGSPPPDDPQDRYIPTARPGHRAPHLWLEPGKSTLDLFRQAFVLMSFSRDLDIKPFIDAAGEKGMPLDVQVIDESRVATEYGQPLVLVRPDGHVAWRGGDALDAATVLDVVRGAAKQA